MVNIEYTKNVASYILFGKKESVKEKNTTMQEGDFIHYSFCFAFRWPCVCESCLFTN
jgi:hypothetical protein